MKKILLTWKENAVKSNVEGIIGMSHSGCCRQDGGCPKKHG